MMSDIEKLWLRLVKTDRSIVRAAIKKWSLSELSKRTSIQSALMNAGWTKIAAEPGVAMLEDGRPIVWVGQHAFVLPMDEHLRRVAMALEMAASQQRQKPRTRSDTPGEALTSVLCPSCRAVMAKSPVCPNCAKGKAGYKILCICTECGHEVYL